MNAVGGLGALSSKYESSGNPGTIARNPGDIGGASYGTYQIATNTGTMRNFLNYAASVSPSVYNALKGKTPGSSSFDEAWKKLANSNPSQFEDVQHGFIAQSHYQPAVDMIKKSTGFDATKRSPIIQDVLWSTAVQHGVNGAKNVFVNAGITPNMSDREITERIYAERAANNGNKYFRKSSEAIRKSVVNRFKSEMKDALSRLGE